MKKTALFLISFALTTTILLAQNQNTEFFTGSKLDPDHGLQLSALNEYIVITGVASDKKSALVEVFIRRGDDPVTLTEYQPKNGVLKIKLKDLLHNRAEFKSGDQIVIKMTQKDIFSIPIM